MLWTCSINSTHTNKYFFLYLLVNWKFFLTSRICRKKYSTWSILCQMLPDDLSFVHNSFSTVFVFCFALGIKISNLLLTLFPRSTFTFVSYHSDRNLSFIQPSRNCCSLIYSKIFLTSINVLYVTWIQIEILCFSNDSTLLEASSCFSFTYVT